MEKGDKNSDVERNVMSLTAQILTIILAAIVLFMFALAAIMSGDEVMRDEDDFT